MYTWTPLAHVRAIEAWPLCRPSQSCRQLRRCFRAGAVATDESNHSICPDLQASVDHSSRGPRIKKLRVRSVANRTSNQHLADLIDPESLDGDRYTSDSRKRRHGDSDLPLPPLMRQNASLRARAYANRAEPDEEDAALPPKNPRIAARREEERQYKYSSTFAGLGRKNHSIKNAMQNSPFSTAFAQNPYAHALAQPVRMDRFSNTRHPLSCLIDFHVVNVSDDPATPKLELKSLSGAAALISKKKSPDKLSETETYINETWNAELFYRPSESVQRTGTCSFLNNSRSLLEWITEAPANRLQKIIKGSHTEEALRRQRLSAVPLQWPDDTPPVLLHSLRSVVCKKMRFLLVNKSRADDPGAMQTPAGNAGLERLDEVDSVMCVLACQPFSTDEATISGQTPPLPLSAKDTRISGNGVSDTSPISASEADIDLNTPSLESIKQPLGEQTPIESEANTPEEAPEDPAGESEHMRKPSATRVLHEGGWKEEAFFLRNVRPLPPPTQPSTKYFPTVRFRNQRVPYYNLPNLLGEEMTTELLKDTVFQNARFIAMTRSFTHVELQTWLFKLGTYLAEKKSETPKF